MLRSTRFLGSAHFFSLVPPEECSPCGHWAVGPSGDGPKCLFDKFVWITLVKVRGGKTAFSLRSNYKFCIFGRSLKVFFCWVCMENSFPTIVLGDCDWWGREFERSFGKGQPKMLNFCGAMSTLNILRRLVEVVSRWNCSNRRVDVSN